MSIRLSVSEKSTTGASAESAEHVFEGPAITLGRDKACEVVLARQAVSRNHARITVDGELSFIEDLGSSFGTQVNGETLPKGEKRLLKTGDTIVIAQFDILFSEQRAMPAPGVDENTSFVSRAMVRGALRGVLSAEDPFFRFMNGEREGDKIPIAEAQELIIGRDPQVDITLSDDLVSRRHAKFRRDLAGVHVEDLDSRNGIKVNKRKVRHRTLKDRDEVEVGAARLLFVDPNAIGEAPSVEVASLVAPRPGGPARPAARPAARKEGAASGPNETRAAGGAGTKTGARPPAAETEAPPKVPEPAPAPAPEPTPEPAPEPEPPAEEPAAPDGYPEGDAEEPMGALEPMAPWAAPEPEPPPEPGGGALAMIPGGARTLVMAGLGLVVLVAVVLMIAILVGA